MRAAPLRNLLVENAMLTEATRAWRKYWRGGSAAGRVINLVVFVLILFGYFWLCLGVTNAVSYAAESWRLLLPYIELLIITILIPVSIYGAVAGERERATWEALILTRLTPGQIIYGKLFWRMLLVVLLVVLMTLPIGINLALFVQARESGSTFLVGDGSAVNLTFTNLFWTQAIPMQAMMICWGVLLCAFGLWVSANSRRSVTAASVTFGTLFAMLGLLPFLFSLLSVGMGGSSNLDNSGWGFLQLILLHYNPYYLVTQTSDIRHLYSGPTNYLINEWVFSYPGAALLYLIAAGWLIYSTHVRLRSLEEPKRR